MRPPERTPNPMPNNPETPDPTEAPIPRSYYEPPAVGQPAVPPPAPAAPPPARGARSWFRGIPGFRTRRAWKEIVAALGHVLILLFILIGFGNLSTAILGWSALGVVLLLTNAWGTRTEVPVLRSSNKLLAAGGMGSHRVTNSGECQLGRPGSAPASGLEGTSPGGVPLFWQCSGGGRSIAKSNARTEPEPRRHPKPIAQPIAESVGRRGTRHPAPAPVHVAPRPLRLRRHHHLRPQESTAIPGDTTSIQATSSPLRQALSATTSIASRASGAGTGYVMQCADDMFSLSGGHSGSCSHHGGNKRPLYSH